MHTSETTFTIACDRCRATHRYTRADPGQAVAMARAHGWVMGPAEDVCRACIEANYSPRAAKGA